MEKGEALVGREKRGGDEGCPVGSDNGGGG